MLHRTELSLILATMLALALAKRTAAGPSSVTIASSFQTEVGCTRNWDAACAITHLTYDAGDDVWQGTWSILGGTWEYKAALNDSWALNYGLHALQNGPNIPFSISVSRRPVKFYYDDKTHWVTDQATSVIATVAGSFQSEMGCTGDWDPTCLRTWLEDPNGDGIYSFSTYAIPAGNYEARVTINESSTVSYGQGGVLNGPNILFSVPTSGTTLTFVYYSASHLLSIFGSVPVPVRNSSWGDVKVIYR